MYSLTQGSMVFPRQGERTSLVYNLNKGSVVFRTPWDIPKVNIHFPSLNYGTKYSLEHAVSTREVQPGTREYGIPWTLGHCQGERTSLGNVALVFPRPRDIS